MNRWTAPRPRRRSPSPWPIIQSRQERRAPDWQSLWNSLDLRLLRGQTTLSAEEILCGLHGEGESEQARAFLQDTQAQTRQWGRYGEHAPCAQAQLRLIAGLSLLQRQQIHPGAALGLYLQASSTFGPTLDDTRATLALDALEDEQLDDPLTTKLAPHLLHLNALSLMLSTLNDRQLPRLLKAFVRTPPQRRLWNTLVGRPIDQLPARVSLASLHPYQLLWRGHPAMSDRRGLRLEHLSSLWPTTELQASLAAPHEQKLRPSVLSAWSRLTGTNRYILITVAELSHHDRRLKATGPANLFSEAAAALILLRQLHASSLRGPEKRSMLLIQGHTNTVNRTWQMSPVMESALNLISVCAGIPPEADRHQTAEATHLQRLIADRSGHSLNKVTQLARKLISTAAVSSSDPERFRFMECYPQMGETDAQADIAAGQGLIGDLNDAAFLQWLGAAVTGMQTTETHRSLLRQQELSEVQNELRLSLDRLGCPQT